MKLLKSALLTLIVMFTFASVALAAGPPPEPLFNDAQGHGWFMEHFEYTFDESGYGYRVTRAYPGIENFWNIEAGGSFRIVIHEREGSVVTLGFIGYEREVVHALMTTFKLLNINLENENTRRAVNRAIGKVNIGQYSSVRVDAFFVDADSGRMFQFTKLPITGTDQTMLMFCIVPAYLLKNS